MEDEKENGNRIAHVRDELERAWEEIGSIEDYREMDDYCRVTRTEERIQVDDVSLGRAMQSCIATVQCDNARDWVLFYGAFNKSQLAFCEVLESLLSELYSQKLLIFMQ